MKQKYTYTVAGQSLSFVSDEDKEFIDSVVIAVNSSIKGIMLSNIRSAKLDAAIITALDLASEKIKAEKKVRSLEAQISLYEATIARMKTVCSIDEDGVPLEKKTAAEKLAEAAKASRAKSDEEVLKLDDAPKPERNKLGELENMLRGHSDNKLNEIASLLKHE